MRERAPSRLSRMIAVAVTVAVVGACELLPLPEPPLARILTREPEPSGAGCPTALTRGELIVDASGYVALRAPEATYVHLWPHGYSIDDEQGRLRVLQPSGIVVAEVGDTVELGGAGTTTGKGEPAWHACGDVFVATPARP